MGEKGCKEEEGKGNERQRTQRKAYGSKERVCVGGEKTEANRERRRGTYRDSDLIGDCRAIASRFTPSDGLDGSNEWVACLCVEGVCA